MSADRRAVLIDRLDKGQLDLALLFGASRRSDAQRLAAFPMTWIRPPGKQRLKWQPDQPLPLALCSPPCFFREAAIPALNQADITCHIAFSSVSVHGIWAGGRCRTRHYPAYCYRLAEAAHDRGAKFRPPAVVNGRCLTSRCGARIDPGSYLIQGDSIRNLGRKLAGEAKSEKTRSLSRAESRINARSEVDG